MNDNSNQIVDEAEINDLPQMTDLQKRVSERFHRLYTRFMEDIQDLTEEMGGEKHFSIEVGPNGITDVTIHLK